MGLAGVWVGSGAGWVAREVPDEDLEESPDKLDATFEVPPRPAPFRRAPLRSSRTRPAGSGQPDPASRAGPARDTSKL